MDPSDELKLPDGNTAPSYTDFAVTYTSKACNTPVSDHFDCPADQKTLW